MTRPLTPGSGLPGVSQQVFGDQAKELGRARVLDGVARVLRFVAGQDDGGAPDDSWTPDEGTIRAHREPLSRGTTSTDVMIAAQTAEKVTHLIWLDPADAASITTSDRLEMDDITWIINGISDWNKPEATALQVREVTG